MNILTNTKYVKSCLLKNNINTKKVVYKVNPTAGLANTLRGLSSTIFLSYLINSRFILSNWIAINYYFVFPKILVSKIKSNTNIVFRKVNNKLLNIVLNNKSIVISDIHGSFSILIKQFKKHITFRQLIYLYSIKSNIELNIKWIIYHEFFSPSNIIQFYVNQFYKYKNTNRILGIHIRSGKFLNFTEKYFHNDNNTIKLFLFKAIDILKSDDCDFVYIISDNIENIVYLRNKLKSRIINITIPGEIYHSRFTLYKDNISLESIKLVTEFFLLSECDIILGTQRSSFSKEASTYNKKVLILI